MPTLVIQSPSIWCGFTTPSSMLLKSRGNCAGVFENDVSTTWTRMSMGSRARMPIASRTSTRTALMVFSVETWTVTR